MPTLHQAHPCPPAAWPCRSWGREISPSPFHPPRNPYKYPSAGRTQTPAKGQGAPGTRDKECGGWSGCVTGNNVCERFTIERRCRPLRWTSQRQETRHRSPCRFPILDENIVKMRESSRPPPHQELVFRQSPVSEDSTATDRRRHALIGPYLLWP